MIISIFEWIFNANFFSAKDGSRAFVTGQFDEAGLTDDLTGLATSDYLGLKEWLTYFWQYIAASVVWVWTSVVGVKWTPHF